MTYFQVWLDEFKEVFYEHVSEHYAKIDPGDLTEAKQVKNSLDCKPFRYFLDQVAPDMVERYPYYDPGAFARGAIQSEADDTMCIGWTSIEKVLGLFKCDKNLTHPKESQDFELSWHRHIKMNKNTEDCITDGKLHVSDCHYEFRNQLWYYDLVSVGRIVAVGFSLSLNFVPEHSSNR